MGNAASLNGAKDQGVGGAVQKTELPENQDTVTDDGTTSCLTTGVKRLNFYLNPPVGLLTKTKQNN